MINFPECEDSVLLSSPNVCLSSSVGSRRAFCGLLCYGRHGRKTSNNMHLAYRPVFHMLDTRLMFSAAHEATLASLAPAYSAVRAPAFPTGYPVGGAQECGAR
jgi:hypothetical protein